MSEASDPRNLTGIWNGLYTYAGGVSVAFMATLIDSGRSLSGSTHESDTVCGGGTLIAMLVGSRTESTVAFVKTYEQPPPLYYAPIAYEGSLSGDATEIEGRWRISDGVSGKFLMIRSGGKAAAVERKKAVRV